MLFENPTKALQYLADITQKRIIIAAVSLSPNKDGKYIPPLGAQKAAKKVLEWKEKYPEEVKAMTRTGWRRARQLAQRKPLSYDIVKRMAKFSRHKKNSKIDPKHKQKPWKDNGYVAWQGWGGDVGINWAKRVIDKVEKEKED